MRYSDAVLLSAATLTPEILSRSVPWHDDFYVGLGMRDYQIDVLRRAAALMRSGVRRVLIQLPTGGGKTVLSIAALLAVEAIGARGQFIVHRKELIDQTSRSFNAAGLDHTFIASGRDFHNHYTTSIAGVQTLVNKLDIQFPPDMVIVDEAHHAAAKTWTTVFEAYPDAYILGLTATPERLDGVGLEEHFDALVCGPTTGELIARGFLSPYDYYAPNRPDMTGVRTERDAETVMDTPELVGDTVEHYLRLARNKRGIVFAHSVEHSKHLVDCFKANGVRAAHLDGNMTEKERTRIDKRFRHGEFDILSNCSLLGEGYDVPGIEYVGIDRHTQSVSLFLQMVGRGLRPIYTPWMRLDSDEERLAAMGDAAILCDHASNVFTHGFPDDEREWQLMGRRKRRAGLVNADAEPIRTCHKCYRVYPSSMSHCPGCGAKKMPTTREIQVREGELLKLEKDALKRQHKVEEKECRSHGDFLKLAIARGYKEPHKWATLRMRLKTQYKARFRRV